MCCVWVTDCGFLRKERENGYWVRHVVFQEVVTRIKLGLFASSRVSFSRVTSEGKLVQFRKPYTLSWAFQRSLPTASQSTQHPDSLSKPLYTLNSSSVFLSLAKQKKTKQKQRATPSVSCFSLHPSPSHLRLHVPVFSLFLAETDSVSGLLQL